MGFRRRTRRRALIAGAAVAHHRDNQYAEQQQVRRRCSGRRLPGSDRNMHPLQRTRPTRSSTSRSCTTRAR